jgi:predicted RNA-binding Zn-ribbon protein involved in translation (DUF1610 family)
MHVGGLLFVSVLLALGSLVALLWIVRRMQRKTRTVAEAPGLWDRRDYRCPQCGAPMEEGWVMLGRGAIWSARRMGRPGTFAHIGVALENTVSLALPPAANTAWRCPTCRLLLVDYDKLVKG